MLTKAEVLTKHYGTTDHLDVFRIGYEARRGPRPPVDQYATIKLPYEAPEHPGIPSMEEIEIGMRDNKLSFPHGFRDVCRVGKCVVKTGGDRIILQEVENMLFLQEHSQVRTPKVYAAFTRRHDVYDLDIYYLVTEYIEGSMLSNEIWDSLDDEARKIICSKLSEQLTLLRSIPSEGYYGRVYHQGFEPRFPILRTHHKAMCGPYDTYEDLVSAMYTTAELSRAIGSIPADFLPVEVDFLSQFKAILGGSSNSKPVLTHMDLKFDNIIVRPIKGDGEKIQDWEVVLIDWDCLAWLPAYMQIAATQGPGRPRDEKHELYLQGLFPDLEEYRVELRFLVLDRDIVHYSIY